VVSLALVLGLIVSGTWLLRKLIPQVNRNGGETPVRVLSTTYLAPKQSLSLIRCGRRIILIGVTPEHISSLAAIDDPAEVSLLTGYSDGRDSRGISYGFDEALEGAADRFEETEVDFDEPLGADSGSLAAVSREVRGLLSRLRSHRADRLPG
jgi:flagellar biogenesis protein FliO